MSTETMTPVEGKADLATEKLAAVTVDPGDGTVCPTLDYVLIRGFHAMGWAHSITACRDMIQAVTGYIRATASPSPVLREAVIEECANLAEAHMRSLGLVKLTDFERGKAASASAIRDDLRTLARAALKQENTDE